jgi:hypothetical protein
MDQNHYRPPRAQVDPRNREPGSIPKAVAIGAVIDIGGTMLGSFLLVMGYALILGLQGQSSAAIDQTLAQLDRWSPFGLMLTAMGIAMSALGGYQCAVVANRSNYLAPGILSLVSVTAGTLMNEGQTLLPQLLFFSALTVAAILGGASLHTRRFSEPQPRPTAKP